MNEQRFILAIHRAFEIGPLPLFHAKRGEFFREYRRWAAVGVECNGTRQYFKTGPLRGRVRAHGVHDNRQTARCCMALEDRRAICGAIKARAFSRSTMPCAKASARRASARGGSSSVRSSTSKGAMAVMKKSGFRTCLRSYCAPVIQGRAVLGMLTYFIYAPLPALRPSLSDGRS